MKWTIIAVAVLILGAGGLIYYSNNSKEEITNESLQDIELSNLDESDNTTRDLAQLRTYLVDGGTGKCEYRYNDENEITSAGTAYFHNKDMRANNTFTQTDGNKTETNVLVKSDKQYVWHDDTGRGYSVNMSASQVDENGEVKKVDKLGVLKLDDNYVINCEAWDVDTAVLEVPTNIAFTDRTDLIQNLPSEIEGLFE